MIDQCFDGGFLPIRRAFVHPDQGTVQVDDVLRNLNAHDEAVGREIVIVHMQGERQKDERQEQAKVKTARSLGRKALLESTSGLAAAEKPSFPGVAGDFTLPQPAV